jgi:hypothetical protein
MRSTQKKIRNIGSMLLGHSLIVIMLYAVYRVGVFVLGQIELPSNIANLGITAFVIMVTLGGTGLLLKFDLKTVPNRIHTHR